MEHKIGEIFEYNDEWYQCVRSTTCSGCGFANGGCIADKHLTGDCSDRLDGASVIFKKLEKLGEPYQYIDGIYQQYKATLPFFIRDATYTETVNGFAVIIKQNKEDMEEKKLNLKPFDIQKAREGKSVCTRDGRKARIICFDRVTNSTNEYTGHLIVLITNLNGDEKPFCYTENGNLAGDEYDNHKWDLMMLHEKKSGWANIIKGVDGCSHMGRGIFQSKEAAEDAIKAFSSKLIDTIKIEWYD